MIIFSQPALFTYMWSGIKEEKGLQHQAFPFLFSKKSKPRLTALWELLED